MESELVAGCLPLIATLPDRDTSNLQAQPLLCAPSSS